LGRRIGLLQAAALVLLLLTAPLVSGCRLSGRSSPTTTAASGAMPQAPATTPAVVSPTGIPAAAPRSTTPASASRVVEGGTGEPRTLNPILVGDSIGESLSHLLFNGLVYVDPASGEPRGDLATAWDVSQDRLTYTFHVRDQVLWHDGQPLTARDVVFTYTLMMNRRAGSPRYSRLVERVREVRASDTRTVVVTLVSPDASFLTTQATYPIVPEHALQNVLPEEVVTDPFGITSAIGTGPFTFQRWDRGNQIVLARNDRYFRGPAAYEQYVYRVLASPDDLVKGLRDGSIDWGALDPGVVETARQDDRIRLVSVPGFNLSVVALQLDPARNKLFLDARVRQALMLALDRTQLAQSVWEGEARVADGTIPPASWAFAESKTIYRLNLDEARRLLDEAGWLPGDDGIRSKSGNRLSFTLLTNGDDPAHLQTVNWLSSTWRAIGVEAVPQVEPWGSVVRRVTGQRDFDAVLLQLRCDLDPDQSAFWSSDSFFDGLNLGHYANAEVDKLLDQALASSDSKERREKYGQIQDVVLKDLPVLPLVFPDQTLGFSKRLQDVQATAILVRNRATIEQWVPRTGG
jgi:peptide/nickel transport system substrate-binding protein